MISFELTNGDLYDPHVPTVSNDDQYVEYELDNLAGFESSAEEERVSLLVGYHMLTKFLIASSTYNER